MKKLIPLLLALTLLLSLGSAAIAAEGNSHTYTDSDNTTLDQTITTKIPDNKILWHLEIPAEVVISEGGVEGFQDVKNVKIVIDSGELTDGQKIEASMTYDGTMTMTTDSSVQLAYVLSDKTVFNGGNTDDTLETGKAYIVGTKTKGDETYNAPYAWVLSGEWDMAPSGSYAGTIQYTSELVEANG